MNVFSPSESRRYLIAIGSPHCPNMDLPSLEGVKTDIERVVKLFTSEAQGYKRVLLDQIPLGSGAQKIKNALSAWFSQSDIKASDCVIIYYAGHADQHDNFRSHYLLTVDSQSEDLPSTAIETCDLVKCFFSRSGESSANILLILDVCYAGQGVNQVMAALSNYQGPIKGGFWGIASVNSQTQAGDGAFVEALEKAMHNSDWISDQEEFLDPHSLIQTINNYLRNKSKETKEVLLQAEINVLGSTNRPFFIRNPRLIKKIQSKTNQEQQIEIIKSFLKSNLLDVSCIETFLNTLDRENITPSQNNILLDKLMQLLNQLKASEHSEHLYKVTQEVSWRSEIYRFYTHLAISSYLENDQNRRELAMISSTKTWENKIIKNYFSSETKIDEAREVFYNLLDHCLGWLLMSIKYCHPVPIPEGFKKDLKSWVPLIIKQGFETLKNELKERIDTEGVDREVDIYLNFLIQQID